MKLESTGFPSQARYQTLTIAAGERGRVYYFPITGGYTAFIRSVANAWAANTYYNWLVDGELIEKVERAIAALNSPLEIKPPIIAKRSIEWYGVNESGASVVFEVVMEGELAKPI